MRHWWNLLFSRKHCNNSENLTHLQYHLATALHSSRDLIFESAHDYGAPFQDNKLDDKAKRFMRNTGVDAPGSCHLLRHAMATHMQRTVLNSGISKQCQEPVTSIRRIPEEILIRKTDMLNSDCLHERRIDSIAISWWIFHFPVQNRLVYAPQRKLHLSRGYCYVPLGCDSL